MNTGNMTDDEFNASKKFVDELENLNDNWVDISKIEPFLDGDYFVKTSCDRIFIAYYDNGFGIFIYDETKEIGWKESTHKELVTHYKKCF